MSQMIDLWGDPIDEPADKRGRPAHVVTDERRTRVAVLQSLNKTHAEIAEAIGISEKTLRTKYRAELKQGLAQKRAEALVLIWDKAKAGNVAALKEYLRQTERSDLGSPRVMRPAAAPKIGKKAQALLDAASPDTSSSMGELMAKRAEGLRLN